MPQTPNRPCRRCKRNLSTDTYCPACAAVVQKKRQDRPPANERGYDWQWSKVRKMKLSADPLCERCMKPATVVHHVEPFERRWDLRLAMDNVQSLCRDCHEVLHGRVKGGYGVDGLPVGGWR